MGCAPVRLTRYAAAAAGSPAFSGAALAAQGPGVAQGSADPATRALAAALVLTPPIAVAVFALAKLLGGEARRR